MRQQLEGDVGATSTVQGQGASGALPLQNTHTNKQTQQTATRSGRREGGPIAQGDNAAPPRYTKTKTPNPGEGSPPPHLPTPRTLHMEAQQHAAPCTTHAVHRGERGGGKAHARTASPTHTPHVGFLENPRRVQRLIYRGGEDRGQAPAGTGGMVKGVQGGVCEEGALSHTPHITSHQPNTCRRSLSQSRTTSPRPGTIARAVGT